MQIEEAKCYPSSRRPRWITSSEICIISYIVRKPNSITVLSFFQNIFFPTSFPPGRLYLLNFVGLFSAQFQDINTGFFLADTPQKVDNIHREIRFAYSCFPTVPSVF